MNSYQTIRIGTRSSALALWQTHYVAQLLQQGGWNTQVVSMETQGDKILDRSLAKIGSKGLFTAELEESLLDGHIDIAVHSAKDLPSQLTDSLQIIAFTEREKVNDVVVSFKKDISLNDTHSWVIGTSSTRRVAMLKHHYPHHTCVDMRGNLQTRLRKLQEGQCDALLLAYAGIHRMDYDAYITELLPTHLFTPAVGQGSIAIEASVHLEKEKYAAIRQCINHTETEICLKAERAFLHCLQGGCSIPAFALATLDEKHSVLSITAGIIRLDGSERISTTFTGTIDQADELGQKIAEYILSAGGKEILFSIRNT